MQRKMAPENPPLFLIDSNEILHIQYRKAVCIDKLITS